MNNNEEIKINISQCEKLGISVLEYVYLYLKYHNKETEISNYHLNQEGFINSKLELTQKTKDLFNNPDPKTDLDYFIETYKLYPHKTKEGRVLKSISLSSQDYKNSEKKYLNYCKSDPYIGLKMYTGLQNQITLLNRSNDGIKFMKDINSWINQKTWERFYELDLTEHSNIVERVKSI